MKSFLLSILLFLFFCGVGQSQEIYKHLSGISSRWSSPENWKGEKGKGGMSRGGRKGSPCFDFKSGTTQVLADVSGSSGIVRRIWITLSQRTPKILRGLKIEMFWDGANTPAVSAPLGDFFNQGLGEMKAFENEFFSSPEGKSFNCFIPMPFRQGMKIQVRNQTDENVTMYFDVDYTLGDRLDSSVLYFHAVFNHQEKTVQKNDYEILPKIAGKGRFMGVNLSIIANQKENLTIWWGEGEVKMYLDGDSNFPTLCGTGTEDYIGSGYSLGEFKHRYQGCSLADHKGMRYAFYRYHVPDPVIFNSDIRVTIQQIGYVGDKDAIDELSKMDRPIIKTGEKSEPVDFASEPKFIMFERSDDYASCAYFYLDKPENNINKP